MSKTIPVHCAHDEIVSITDLKPNPLNPNKHSDAQIALLAKIIKGQGWRNPIVVSQRSGLITKGHARLSAAKLIGTDTAPIDFQAYASEKEEWADMIADNRIAELAEPDRGMLAELMEQIDDGSFDMDLTGFDHDALEELMTAAPPESEVDAEPQIDKADELRVKWGVERGQIWELGDHRIMCGDSTEKRDVEALLGQEKPNLMVTDPPYGVNYDASWRNDAAAKGLIGQKKSTRAIGKVYNDDRADWSEAWLNFHGDVAYVWHAATKTHIVAQSLVESGFQLRSGIVWAKNNFAIGRGHYHPKHEQCWYAVRNGATGHWRGDRSQTTLWEIDKPMRSETGHSTQKPVECMTRAIHNHSCVEVYEPFCGSGTTIIACEQLGRKCRAMEIDPGYVAVSIQRWADATGKTPKLLSK